MGRLFLLTAAMLIGITAASAGDAQPQGGTTATSLAKAWAVDRVIENAKSANRESGELDKAIRVLGPSVRDIKKHGIFGGPNSVFRKPFG